MTKTLAFAPYRIAPLSVLVVEAKQPLVRTGCGSLKLGSLDLREDVYDNAANSVARARTNVYSVYDIALSGGEPYAIWL
jgi:hypothetical protein